MNTLLFFAKPNQFYTVLYLFSFLHAHTGTTVKGTSWSSSPPPSFDRLIINFPEKKIQDKYATKNFITIILMTYKS